MASSPSFASPREWGVLSVAYKAGLDMKARRINKIAII